MTSQDASLSRSASTSVSARSMSPGPASSESSSLLFAAVPDSDRSEASSVVNQGPGARRNQYNRPSTSTGVGDSAVKENHAALTRALFNDDSSLSRGSVSMSLASTSTEFPSAVSSYSLHSHRPSNASTLQGLRKSTSQSQLPPIDSRQRVDSNATTVTVRSTVWVGSTNANRSDGPTKLIRKQRSLHNVAIPPVPRQAVPQPPTPGALRSPPLFCLVIVSAGEPSTDLVCIGTSPTGTSLLSSWSLKRRSGSRGGEPPESTFLSLGSAGAATKDENSSPLQHVGSVKSAKGQDRWPGVTSPARPGTPQSTFFDDTDSLHSHEVGSPRSRRTSITARRLSDIVQYIIPPDELASSWGAASASASALQTDSDAKEGESSSTPSDSSTRVPAAAASKSMPSSPTRRETTKGSSASMPPSRTGSFVGGKRPDELLVLTSPVGFGGGLALAPMPPRKPQSLSVGRVRGGSLLGEASRSAGLQPPPRGSRHPSLAPSSVRSDSALRSLANNHALRGTSPAALDLMTTQSHRISKASSGSGASSSDAFSPTSAASLPPAVGRNRSILKKPSFLDFDEADDRRARGGAGQRVRTKPVQVQLTPPPPSPTPPPSKPKSASTSGRSVVADTEDVPDSFLDLGRMSFETSQTSGTEDTGVDVLSASEHDHSSEYLKWGR